MHSDLPGAPSLQHTSDHHLLRIIGYIGTQREKYPSKVLIRASHHFWYFHALLEATENKGQTAVEELPSKELEFESFFVLTLTYMQQGDLTQI